MTLGGERPSWSDETPPSLPPPELLSFFITASPTPATGWGHKERKVEKQDQETAVGKCRGVLDIQARDGSTTREVQVFDEQCHRGYLLIASYPQFRKKTL